MSLTDIGRETTGSGSGDGDSEYVDYSELEYEPFMAGSETAFTKQHPTSAVVGMPVALRYYPGYEESEYGADEWGQGDVVLILDEARILRELELEIDEDTTVTDDGDLAESVIVELDDDESDDYKVVNLDDDVTEFRADRGSIEFDGRKSFGSLVDGDAFPDGRIGLKITGNARFWAARVLDLHGAESATVPRDEDGEPLREAHGGFVRQWGLVEYHPDDEAPYKRFDRHTELRPDVEGEEVGILLQRRAEVVEDYDGRGYHVTVLHNESGQGGTTFSRLTPTSEFEPSDELKSTGRLKWTFPETDTESDDESADEEEEPVEAE